MVNDDRDVAEVIHEILKLLIERPEPVAKSEIFKRYELDRRRAYDDAIAAVRVLGLVALSGQRQQVVSLTDVGRHVASGDSAVTAADIAKEFMAYRRARPRHEPPSDMDYRLPSIESVYKNLSRVGDRDTATLLRIRQNAAKMREKAFRMEMKFCLTVYIAAIDREFERRSLDPFNDEWFKWPDTDAPGGDGSVAGVAMMDTGMLSVMGYHVGITNGLEPSERQQILREVFENVLPPLFPPHYLDKWGSKGTAHRLKALANTIAALTRNMKRKHDDRLAAAIDDYEADLNWLHDVYYVGKFRFDWPSTKV